jgi:hypothetical protein
METVIVTLKNAKAKKLLQDLEELDLIEVKEITSLQQNTSTKISDLKDMMKPPFESNEEIDKQLAQLSSEWDRNF